MLVTSTGFEFLGECKVKVFEGHKKLKMAIAGIIVVVVTGYTNDE